MKRFVKNMKTAGLILMSSMMLVTAIAPAAFAENLQSTYKVADASQEARQKYESLNFKMGIMKRGMYLPEDLQIIDDEDDDVNEILADEILENNKVVVVDDIDGMPFITVVEMGKENLSVFLPLKEKHGQYQAVCYGINMVFNMSTGIDEALEQPVLIEALSDKTISVTYYATDTMNVLSKEKYVYRMSEREMFDNETMVDMRDAAIGLFVKNKGPENIVSEFPSWVNVPQEPGTDPGGQPGVPDTPVIPDEPDYPDYPDYPDEPGPAPGDKEAQAFYDVGPEAWYYKFVNKLGLFGILQGKEVGYFYPDAPLTRAEFVTMLMRIAPPSYKVDPEELRPYDTFYDVPYESWYRPYSTWGAVTGVAVGYGGYFNGDSYITRQEMAKMTYNFYVAVYSDYGIRFKELHEDIYFVDEHNIADWARSEIHQLFRFGLMRGMPDGTFYPQGNATRAEAAKLIYLLYLPTWSNETEYRE